MKASYRDCCRRAPTTGQDLPERQPTDAAVRTAHALSAVHQPPG